MVDSDKVENEKSSAENKNTSEKISLGEGKEKEEEAVDPSKEKECCGFVGIEPVGGRLEGLCEFRIVDLDTIFHVHNLFKLNSSEITGHDLLQVVPLFLRHQVGLQGLWQADLR